MEISQTQNKAKRLKVLLSAYACRPDMGSEPGVGWNMARELVKHYSIWVITREENRFSIASELSQNPVPGLNVIYYDLPSWARWWKKPSQGVHLHHYLWQIGVYFLAQKLHREINFDLVHHVTYGRYSAPSFLSLLPVPFIWGPVGGGESAPAPFWQDFTFRNKIYESLRNLASWVGERDPFVHLTVKRSKVAIVATPETSLRVSALGAKRIEVIFGQTGVNQQELAQLGQLPVQSSQTPIRFVSIGRLLHWKGFHLGIRAFAQANLQESEYWIVGDGAERQRLEALTQELQIADRVRFFGNLPREKTLQKLGECDVLVHPSLHDFSPTVCLEAMAANRPVICLDLGGPATQITEETGFKVAAHTPEQAVTDMAKVMVDLASEPKMRVRMGQAGRQRISQLYSWEMKGKFLKELYTEIVQQGV
ncbi:glycosyltransferase family 4 protein [Hassallia byssoidea VB512170]|uniref:Glycosyltransferase family 4 protein n=1 Tax=Hassallia byssoidea VB512170 TaxID=1304833 RepID=A0A846HJ55_9CYAN|nr:glycosyltransferase family 4 protein [Hassalia byssoidea]NEU76744.1 glycosyltransferase family 4 protein [Hassalia byssoidea VB512170]